MNQQCLNRRIPSWDKLHSELVAWETRKNEKCATINWMFNVDGTRNKLTRAYEQQNPFNKSSCQNCRIEYS